MLQGKKYTEISPENRIKTFRGAVSNAKHTEWGIQHGPDCLIIPELLKQFFKQWVTALHVFAGRIRNGHIGNNHAVAGFGVFVHFYDSVHGNGGGMGGRII